MFPGNSNITVDQAIASVLITQPYMKYHIVPNFDEGKYWRIGFVQKFDRENIDGLDNLYLLYN